MNKNKLCFIFHNDELLIKEKDGNIVIPNAIDVQALGICLSNLDLLTIKDTTDFLFGELHISLTEIAEFKFYKLRVLITAIDNPTFNLAAKAFHLLKWDNTYKYCSKCGTLVEDKKDERAKICPKCGLISYPRISPAIITAVTKNDKLLLAHNANFPKGTYSVIAGFAEPGETFEDCVAREVFEEVGVHVKNIRYFGSQPWPFPDSLMVAFTCEYASGEIKVDGIEIDDASFYGAEDLPTLPLGGSIARRLIDWFIIRQTKY
ncbi:NAD(+) diphosphatase [Clostridium bovifaecis]|uniref:NAD(+) diphosphatase n=1 Tax=Clostridium bovifaecis TaxID=2184719 RepID=A0A6I6F9Y5_9CLOT|nr:NAD(+) diphosphatase [Clostridium bovifaecis]